MTKDRHSTFPPLCHIFKGGSSGVNVRSSGVNVRSSGEVNVRSSGEVKVRPSGGVVVGKC